MTEENLKELLARMTIKEKIGQMTQFPAAYYLDNEENLTGPMEEENIDPEDIWLAGSTLAFNRAEDSLKFQKKFIENSRLGIPAFFGGDVIHGFRTAFPIPLAMAASWNPEMIEEMARISAKEASVSGIHVNYSPMVDMVRDPRWGRVMESTGEDPYLNSVMAEAFVKGYQGDDLLNDNYRMASTVKHFAAYGAPDGGRDYNTVDMSELKLRQTYLPAYKAAIDAGAKLIMTSFNTVFAMPSTGNRWLLSDLLRDEWGFDGVVISDWGSVAELIPHGVAGDAADASKLSIEAGMDIEMATSNYYRAVEELVETGALDEKLLDDAVWRILKLKNDMGLFENPYRAASIEAEQKIHLAKEHLDYSLELSKKSIVMLKNAENILPLDKDENIALLGPVSNSNDLLGGWPGSTRREEAETLEDVFAKAFKNLSMLDLVCTHEEISVEYIEAAVELAAKQDKIILALGEPSSYSAEAKSRSNIKLPQAQIDLFNAIYEVNKNIVVVFTCGRPLDLTEVQSAKAIVNIWYLGNMAAEASKQVLLGEYNPSGKLTMSFPQNVGQVPVYYNCFNTGRPWSGRIDEEYVSRYMDIENVARYPFGFGLSYANFEYSNLTLDKDKMNADEKIELTVTVKNNSDFDGIETIQLYIRDLVAEIVRPLKELKSFKQVKIAAGEAFTVNFEIDETMLRYVHPDMKNRSDKGKFQVMVGGSSDDVISAEFELV